jgi:soluble lytic murein transglycosylase-like protein
MKAKLTRLLCLAAVTLGAATTALASAVNPPDEQLRAALVAAMAEPDSFQDKYEAEVWLMDYIRRLETRAGDKIPGPERVRFLKQVHHEAKLSKLQPELVLAVIDVESRFNRWAISNVGAQGLMQIMPFWLKEIGRPNDSLFEVHTNLRFGCTILQHYLKRESGDLPRALARYNGSLGSWKYPDLVFGALRNRWFKR